MNGSVWGPLYVEGTIISFGGMDGVVDLVPGDGRGMDGMDHMDGRRTRTDTDEHGRRRWRRRSWRVAERAARAEVWCGCGRLVVIGEWDGVAWCECGQCYRLVCSVKMEVFNE